MRTKTKPNWMGRKMEKIKDQDIYILRVESRRRNEGVHTPRKLLTLK